MSAASSLTEAKLPARIFSQERESYTLVRFQSFEKQPDVEFAAQQEHLPAIFDAIAKAGIEIRQGY